MVMSIKSAFAGGFSLVIMVCLMAGCGSLRPLAEMRRAEPCGRIIAIGKDEVHWREWPGPRADAPVAVLLHGFASSTSTWDRLAPALARSHRVIAVDLPGNGLSSRPAGSVAYTPDGQMAMLTKVLEDARVARFDVVGHSYGGFLALRWAAREPERIRSVVAIAPPDPGRRITPRVRPVLAAMLYPVARFLIDSPTRLVPALELAYGPHAAVPAGMAAHYRDMLLVDGFARYYFGSMAASETVENPWQPDRITVPVALIWGQDDRVVPITTSGRLADQLADALVFPLRDGHMVHEMSADAVGTIILRHWQPKRQ